MEIPWSSGDIVELRVERLAYGGDGVARLEIAGTSKSQFVVFVQGGMPGDRLRVRLVERRKRFARAQIVQTIEASPERREPPCIHYRNCGGCSLQEITHAAQLEAKRGFVLDALQRLGGGAWEGPVEVVADGEFGTRTRARFALDAETGAVGFRRRGAWDVVDLEDCPALAPELEQGRRELRDRYRRLDRSERTLLPSEVSAAIDERSVAFAPAVLGLPSSSLRPRVGEHEFEVPPDVFFQAHAGLLPRLVDAATEGLTGTVAWDLYAGVGLFAAALITRFEKVEAVESNTAAVRAARAARPSKTHPGLNFHHAPVERWVRQPGVHVDAVILDPPSDGAKQAIPFVLAAKPRWIRYVSCNPATLARDLRTLIEGGYRIERVTAFDLFPQTWHVETVVSLIRDDSEENER